MSSTEAPISINLKTAGGTQITLRAETPDDFTALTAGIFQIVEAVGEVETAVRGSAPVNTATPPDPQVAAIASQFNAAPTSGQRMCPHGPMTRIHGLTGKFGPYKGHFCPAPQGATNKCTTQYIKANQPEWNSFQPDSTKA